MNYEISGRVAEVYPTVRVSDRFRKREFVIEHKESSAGQTFVDFIKFQLTQDKCEIIDETWLRQEVTVRFGIKGNRWEKNGTVNYITNLNAFAVNRSTATNEDGQQNIPDKNLEDAPPPDEEFGDLPF